MIWHQSGARLLIFLCDGEQTGWKIYKYGLQEPYHYELWLEEKFFGRFVSAVDAKKEQEILQKKLARQSDMF